MKKPSEGKWLARWFGYVATLIDRPGVRFEMPKGVHRAELIEVHIAGGKVRTWRQLTRRHNRAELMAMAAQALNETGTETP